MKTAAESLLQLPLSELHSVDITAAEFKRDPFPFYARLREEAPVFSVRVRGKQRAWLVTRYDDVLAVLRDPETFVKNRALAMSPEQLKRAPRMPALFKALERNLLSLDGGDHSRLRALVQQAFTPRTVERMRDTTQRAADDALDRAVEKHDFDLLSEFALPVPLSIIGQILGIPPEDHRRFGRWTRAFVSVGSSRNPNFLLPSILQFVRYLRGLTKERALRPRDDLISALVSAQEGSDRLTPDEVRAMVFLLLSAGHETTVNLIASGTLALLQHPVAIARLRTEPELMRSAIEELVRWVVPAEMATERYPTRDVEIAGTVIPRGEMVLAVIGAANRDPRQFPDADGLDLSRANNRHLSFGQGLHYCLGAPLSRMEAQIALGTLLRRAPDLRLRIAPEQLRWRPGFILRGLEALPVSCGATSG